MPQKTIKNDNLIWAFFGTSEVSVSVLDALKKAGFIPSLIITTPDRPKGRKLTLTPPPAKIWALKNNIKILQPENLDGDFMNELKNKKWDLFVVVAFGKIIPEEILNIPKYKSINIHYSLLPKLRGSSPVEGAILADEKETGVSIILMDEKMDHGPIISQERIKTSDWPPTRTNLMESMNAVAGRLLADTIPKWIKGEIIPKEQEHDKATYVKMIKKEDALIDLNDDNYLNFRKIMAFERWPRAYFIENNKRVIINSAKWINNKLEITRVTPEGKKEMNYRDYISGKNRPNLNIG